MGQKVNPIGFRLGVRRNWSARWYANKNEYSSFMAEDNKIRSFLEKNSKLLFPESIEEHLLAHELQSGRLERNCHWKKGQELDSLKDSLIRLLARTLG